MQVNILFVSIFSIATAAYIDIDSGDNNQTGFSRGGIFQPTAFHGRSKREILHTKINENNKQHLEDISVTLVIEGKRHHADLVLNRELIPQGYFEKYQENGGHVVKNPGREEVELCHYQGKLRNVPESWAAISTCQGLRGTVFDGKELYYLRPATRSHLIHGADHHLYSHSDLLDNSTGRNDEKQANSQILDSILRNKREKRSIIVEGPYESNEQSRYVELVLVADQSELRAHHSLQNVISHCKDIVNIVNSLYKPLNVFIALVGVVVWTEKDEIPDSNSGNELLKSFLEYRTQSLLKNHPNDNAILITKKKFKNDIVGWGMVGGMCSLEYSAGIVSDCREVGRTATTMAHEIGHNFNMTHDTGDCYCKGSSCIMASKTLPSSLHWSSCSVNEIKHWFRDGFGDCLHNKPKKLFGDAVCGNGWLEAGEECDCGLSCDNSCCNPHTCRLKSHATCASGSCCNLETCQLKSSGTVCRVKNHECDLSEHCTGKSEFCPSDVFLMNGSPCNTKNAYCYEGTCRSHQEQCQAVWGHDVDNGVAACYQLNTKGDLHGNCGKNYLENTYKKCENEDLTCGRLQCNVDKTRTSKAENMRSGFYEMKSMYDTIHCRTIEVSNQIDHGLVPNGAFCGKEKMCINQKCVAISSVPKSKECVNNCSNNGVCNNQGHCHCNEGFSPPDCSTRGNGGSMDSGPVTEPHVTQDSDLYEDWL